MKQLDLLEPPMATCASALHSFHARAHVTVPEVMEGERRARSQEDAVLGWMRAHPGRHTPWDLAEALGLCINSVRRSMTNLAHANPARLRHIEGERRVAGPWGQRSGVWEATA